ncbi:MAG: D-alanyl-D-alanine carboxypeptidase family protein [Myxococcales bacterium]
MGYRNGRPYRIHLKSIGGGKYLSAPAADAFNRMRAAAARQGVTLTAVSGFRSMAQQQALWRKYGPPRAARPGYSNHQSGVAVDIATNNSRNSAAYRWLARNGRAYGFYNTVSYEPWHWEYRR